MDRSAKPMDESGVVVWREYHWKCSVQSRTLSRTVEMRSVRRFLLRDAWRHRREYWNMTRWLKENAS